MDVPNGYDFLDGVWFDPETIIEEFFSGSLGEWVWEKRCKEFSCEQGGM